MSFSGSQRPTEGGALYAAVRTLPLPTEPMARLWRGANLLREHRGDGHVAALVTVGSGGTEAHVLHALSEGMPASQLGRVGHLPRAQLAAVVDAMRARGLVGADGWLTAAGRQIKERVEGQGRMGADESDADGVAVVHAPGEGDDTIAAIAETHREVVVVTADRGLAERVRAANGTVVGPSWLLDQLVD